MTLPADDDRIGIQSIARAAAVLRALGASQDSLSLGALAAATGLPRSTVQRLVQALQQERLVQIGGPGVSLGPGISELARAIRVDVVRLARPHLQTLFDTVNETVDLSTVQGVRVRFLDMIVSDQELRVVPRRDASLALHCMANGKALLAALPDGAVARLLGGVLVRPTGRGNACLDDLLVELRQIRRTGFAYDRQEHSVGVCAVGMPIRAVDGWPYAVSVAVPEQRFEAVLPAVQAALEVCKAGIEHALPEGHGR
jgi:DNA-binding IclR family transcriptional regulator